MAYTSVRDYDCTAPPTDAVPTGEWNHINNTHWQVRPALWPFLSAFVVQRPYAPPSLLTVAAETALLMENTVWRPGAPLSWSGAAMSCPSHMSRFLTESLGLCIALGSASAYGWTPLNALLDADRLSAANPLYVATGTRPDFIAQINRGWHGIEARGRGSRGPVTHERPIACQKKKVAGMHRWSTAVGAHAGVPAPPSWSMSWAWITDTETSVDHFDPGVPIELSARREQEVWDTMSATASQLENVDDPRVQRLQLLDRQAAVVSRPVLDSDGSGRTSWLTVASWEERLPPREVAERRAALVGPRRGPLVDLTDQDLGDMVSDPEDVALGAFMATAVTERPPVEGDETVSLIEGIVRRVVDADT